jgi:hypothetical protein
MRTPERHRILPAYSPCFVLLVQGCAGTSIYQQVADNLFSRDRESPSNYETVWRPLDLEAEKIPAPDQRALFRDGVSACVDQLKREKGEFIGSREVNQSVATIQLTQCLKQRGWELAVHQSIRLE